MKKNLTNMLRSALLILATTLVLPAFADDDNIASNMDILREKVVADKKFVVANNMKLTEAEAKTFWPIYDAYQQDLHEINERMAKLISDYALAYNKGAVPDETARKLLDEAIAVEQAEVKLKQSYVPKLSKVLPGVKVARYLQIENKIRAIVRYDLAAAIPLME
ncbi:hypothetical protein [Nitrosospira sp. NpAV]|uniref:hypothetical protein n=1 Tax=Nitrosospira sp. NpAV TaxID=58133 RepID=UPI0005A1E99A|nr:hypothetical protein [Nitrosospira sp. NpAV]KIO49813.1 hypothetical protein SQ11_02470 [Nitrosospira sp. NpAV]